MNKSWVVLYSMLILSGIDPSQQNIFLCKFVSYFRLVGFVTGFDVVYWFCVCVWFNFSFTILQETLGALLFCFLNALIFLDDPIPLCMTNSCLTLAQSCVSLIQSKQFFEAQWSCPELINKSN